VEWRFGSIGSYPSVLSFLPVNSVVAVNPPFTEAYLADVMARLAELKLRFRLRIAIPIQEMPWRKKLQGSLPGAEILSTYYDASADNFQDLLHPTLLWEDPRCPQRGGQADLSNPSVAAAALAAELNAASRRLGETAPWPPDMAPYEGGGGDPHTESVGLFRGAGPYHANGVDGEDFGTPAPPSAEGSEREEEPSKPLDVMEWPDLGAVVKKKGKARK